MTSLAWNLKAWFGLLLPNSQRGLDLIKMEFRRFLHAMVLLPAQIVGERHLPLDNGLLFGLGLVWLRHFKPNIQRHFNSFAHLHAVKIVRSSFSLT